MTIAAEPLFRDDLAGQVFDKGDIVTRGIIPFAIAIFNDNDFPVQVDARSVELICGDERYRTLMPGEVVTRLYQKTGKGVRLPQPIPGISLGGGDASREPLQDFEQKFLAGKIVPPRGNSGGFLYFEISIKALQPYLAASQLYLPDVYPAFLGRHVVIQRGAARTVAALRALGYEVHEVETGEYMKSGGSVFCLKMQVF